MTDEALPETFDVRTDPSTRFSVLGNQLRPLGYVLLLRFWTQFFQISNA